MDSDDEIYDRERITEISEELEAIERLNRQAILMAFQCEDIVLIHKEIKQYMEKEPFTLKGNPYSKKSSRMVQYCLKELIKACDRYLRRNYHLLARIVLIRERSKVALERCCLCYSLGQGVTKCEMLEALADLDFDDELKSVSLGEERKKNKE